MALFLLNNGTFSGEAELLGYAESQRLAMIERCNINFAPDSGASRCSATR